MAEEEKKAPIDETEVIPTEELRDILKEKEIQNKKECWLKRLFKRKNKK